MPGKIWQKYFIKETAKVFTFILLGFYGLYVLIDFATRSSSQSYFHTKISALELMQYYLFELVQKLDVLIPFALLIATIRTLTQLNLQNELIALLASGVKMKKLLRPFVFLSLISVGALFLNSQYFVPYALEEIRHTKDIHALQKSKKKRKIFAQSIPLKNHTTLIFQDYDPIKELFFDAYWIKSFDEVYHIKWLLPKKKSPLGKHVEWIKRDSDGNMTKAGAFESKEFHEIRFNKKVLLDTITPPEEMPLTKLWSKIQQNGKPSNEKEAEMTTVFYQKLMMPWLALLAVLAPAPFCVRFTRNFPQFLIYGICIFGLAAFYVVMGAFAVIGYRQVLSPFCSVFPPFFALSAPIFWRWFRLK